jgi:hypothetical protein
MADIDLDYVIECIVPGASFRVFDDGTSQEEDHADEAVWVM